MEGKPWNYSIFGNLEKWNFWETSKMKRTGSNDRKTLKKFHFWKLWKLKSFRDLKNEENRKRWKERGSPGQTGKHQWPGAKFQNHIFLHKKCWKGFQIIRFFHRNLDILIIRRGKTITSSILLTWEVAPVADGQLGVWNRFKIDISTIWRPWWYPVQCSK